MGGNRAGRHQLSLSENRLDRGSDRDQPDRLLADWEPRPMEGTLRHGPASRPRELHTVHSADDVIDCIEQCRVSSEDLVDEWAAPRLDKLFRLEATTNPSCADPSNRRVDRGIATFDSDGRESRRVEATGGVGVDNHCVSVVQCLLCNPRVVHWRAHLPQMAKS